MVLSALLSAPWAIHNLMMLSAGENFGWGIFALVFFDAPMALVLSTQLQRVPKAIVVTVWAITIFTIVSAVSVAAFGKASGC